MVNETLNHATIDVCAGYQQEGNGGIWALAVDEHEQKGKQETHGHDMPSNVTSELSRLSSLTVMPAELMP